MSDARTDMGYNFAKFRELYRTNFTDPAQVDLSGMKDTPITDDQHVKIEFARELLQIIDNELWVESFDKLEIVFLSHEILSD